jgi:hypothetical protein
MPLDAAPTAVGHDNRLRAAGVPPVWINLDQRKHGPQSGQGRQVVLRIAGDVGRPDADHTRIQFDDVDLNIGMARPR